MKKLKNIIQLALMTIPVILAVAAAVKSSALLAIGSAVAILLLIFILPISSGRENLWTFFLYAIIAVPINIKLIVATFEDFFYIELLSPVGIMASILIFFILLSVEELCAGILMRIAKPHQLDFEN